MLCRTRFWTHPAFAGILLLIFCRLGVPVFESGPTAASGGRILFDKAFYPLNSFPMYADPGPEPSDFVIVCDGAGNPLNVRKLTGESSAKVKKKYIDIRNDMARAVGIREGAMATPAIREQAWTETLRRLTRLAERRRQTLPHDAQLKLGAIHQEDGTFREVIRLEAGGKESSL